MPTLLHLADVHLGARLRFLGGRGGEHRRNIREAFRRALDAALQRRVDAVLVAGDLFDSNQPGRETVAFARHHLGRLAEAGIAVRLLPGTHDALIPGGVYAWAGFEDAGDVRVYRGEGAGGWDVETLAGGGLAVFARPTVEKGGGLPALRDLPRDAATGGRGGDAVRVGLVHATLDLGANTEEDYVIHPGDVAASGLDYVAAGHWHAPREADHGGVPVRYPGSPEPVSREPRARGIALLVTLEPGRPARVEPAEVGRVRVEALDYDLTGRTDPAHLDAELRHRADGDAILRLRLEGLRDPGWTRTAAEIEEAHGDAFFHLAVSDEAVDDVGAERLPGDERLIAGRFASRLRHRIEEARRAGDEDERDAAAEALRLGLALLDGRDAW